MVLADDALVVLLVEPSFFPSTRCTIGLLAVGFDVVAVVVLFMIVLLDLFDTNSILVLFSFSCCCLSYIAACSFAGISTRKRKVVIQNISYE